MNLAEQKAAHDALEAQLKTGAMQRAYSSIEIKAIDEDERVIEGIATTPTPDRMDDIVEPDGAVFKLPIALLWQHNSREPVGHVFEAKVTSEGIRIKARFVKVSEPASLKDDLDRCWSMVKSGLVRALSIGFSPIEWSDIKNSWGVRFTSWEWLELSCVTIPANADASITSVKAIDREYLRAASGRNAGGVVVRLDKTTPGVTGFPAKTSKGKSVKTIREQIESFEASLAAAKEKRDGVMQKSAEEGRTLDEAEKQEYETAAGEVKELVEHIDRLKDLESEQLKRAKPVTKDAGIDSERGTEARRPNSGIISVRPNVEKGIPFARYVKAMAMAKGNVMHAHEIAKANKGWHDTTPQVEMFLKTAVGAGTSTGSAWADDLVYAQNLSSDFIEYLRPATLIGKIQNLLRRVPFNIRVGSITSGGTAYWVGSGVPIPLSKLQTDNLTLERTKSAGLMSITQELALDSSPSAELLVRDDLRDCIAAMLDVSFIDPNRAAVANVSPASITNGVTGILPSGTTAGALRTDVQNLRAGFITANIPAMSGVWIMTETLFVVLSGMTNALGQPEFPTMGNDQPTFGGRPVFVTQALNIAGSPTVGDMLIYLIPSEIMLADDGEVAVEVSNQASLEMSDAPANNAATGTGASMVSMFQTDSLAIRAIRFINWKKRRSAAVQYIYNARYTA
jgi:HK97 family phage major capsid protein/HK97 family phage prohead protease